MHEQITSKSQPANFSLSHKITLLLLFILGLAAITCQFYIPNIPWQPFIGIAIASFSVAIFLIKHLRSWKAASKNYHLTIGTLGVLSLVEMVAAAFLLPEALQSLGMYIGMALFCLTSVFHLLCIRFEKRGYAIATSATTTLACMLVLVISLVAVAVAVAKAQVTSFFTAATISAISAAIILCCMIFTACSKKWRNLVATPHYYTAVAAILFGLLSITLVGILPTFSMALGKLFSPTIIVGITCGSAGVSLLGTTAMIYKIATIPRTTAKNRSTQQISYKANNHLYSAMLGGHSFHRSGSFLAIKNFLGSAKNPGRSDDDNLSPSDTQNPPNTPNSSPGDATTPDEIISTSVQPAITSTPVGFTRFL